MGFIQSYSKEFIMYKIFKITIFLLFLNIPFSISVFSQKIDYNAKEIFVREGFGFAYSEDEISSLSVFYEKSRAANKNK